jgi:hypothetical protein
MSLEMEYNSTRPKLDLPEYGRNVKKMVNHALTIEDKSERQKCVDAIIKVMGQLNPHLRDIEDYKHKLWDHIWIMSDFKLDVESPYPVPAKESFETKPNKVEYPVGKLRYGHYGKATQNIINLIPEEKDEEKKKELINITANMMKRFYLSWNRDSVQDQTIVDHLNELSNGKLTLKVEDIEFKSTQEILRSQNFQRNRRPSKSHHGRGGGKGKKNNNYRKKRY